MNNSRCFFISTSWRDRSTPNHFKNLGYELANRGHTVVILVDRQRYDAQQHDENPSIFTWPSSRPTSLRDAEFLRKLIRRFKPDCMISNFGSVNVMILVGFMMHVPVRTAWYHTLSRAVEIEAPYTAFRLKILRIRKGLIYRLATQIVTNSVAAQRDLRETFKVPLRKSIVFPNSIPDQIQSDEGATIGERDHRIVCAGSMNHNKGQDVLLNAFSKLKSTMPELTVELIGGGYMLNKYKSLARELGIERNCHFTGTLNNQNVLEKMTRALACIVPSRSEAFGNVVIECMSVGTPVIGSRVGGIKEIVRDGIDGYLVSPDDPQALAERIKRIVANPSLRERMGINARKRFLDRYESQKNIKIQADWFENLVVEKRKTA